jgi:hypothetical protein
MKKITLNANIGNRDNTFSFDYEMSLEIPKDSHASVEGLLNKGFGEILRDKFSTFKIKAVGDTPERDATPEEKDAWTRKTEKALQDGTYTFGGFGARLSPEDKAMKAALKASGHPVKKDDTIENVLEQATKALAEEQEKDFTPEMVEKVRAMLKASEVYKTELKNAKPKKAADLSELSL